MKTTISVKVNEPVGGLEMHVSAYEAMQVLNVVSFGTFCLLKAVAGKSLRTRQPFGQIFKRVDLRNQQGCSATVELSDSKCIEETIELLAMTLKPDVLVSDPNASRRGILMRINNVLAGNQLVATVSIGGSSIMLDRPMRAEVLQRGQPWAGEITGLLGSVNVRATRITLMPLRNVLDGCEAVEVDLHWHRGFLAELKLDLPEAIYVKGRGTLNGRRLQVAEVQSVRNATEDDGVDVDLVPGN